MSQKGGTWPLIVVASVFLIIIVNVIGMKTGLFTAPPDPVPTPFVMDRDKAITFADWAIQQDLSKSNYDYKFPDYADAIVTHNPDDTWTVQSDFAFKNYAGEMEQHQLRITMQNDPTTHNTSTVRTQIL